MSGAWREIPFAEFATLQRGADLPVNERRSGTIPVLASNGPVGYHAIPFAMGPGVVTGRSGTIGKPTFIAGPYWPLNTVLWVSDFHGNDPRFVFYFFQHFDFVAYATGTSVPTLNRNFVHGVPVNVPPKLEQEKIAAVLWKVERAIEVEEKLAAAARELRRSAMRQLFTRGLRGEPQKETEIGSLPASWEVEPIRANAKLVAGGTPSRTVKEYWEGGTIPWVKTGEVDYCVITHTAEKITPAGRENSAAKLIPKGTVLIAMYGQGVTRGKVAILGIEATTNQACAGIIPTNGKVLPLYLYHFLSFSYDRLRSLSHGAQQQNLTGELVGSVQVAVPAKDEQAQIVEILEAIDRKISLHMRKWTRLQELFKTLLHQLMTGQIRVHHLDIDLSEIQ